MSFKDRKLMQVIAIVGICDFDPQNKRAKLNTSLTLCIEFGKHDPNKASGFM